MIAKEVYQVEVHHFCAMNFSGDNTRLRSKKLLSGTQRMFLLQQSVLHFSFSGLLIVTSLGMLLRAFPYLPSFPLSYKNLLHAHSHLAFGGWAMPVLLALILKAFPVLTRKVAVRHWRNIGLLLLLSAAGMLVYFPLQGYGAISIAFSTLGIVAGCYLFLVIRKAAPARMSATSWLFVRAGLFYLVLSALGPLATGPLVAAGKSGSPLYYNAIYFYLHFQYNGWFTFAVLAVLYRLLEQKGTAARGKAVFWLLHFSCVPAYLLSVLWTQPPVIINVLGGLAAFLQLIAACFLFIDMKGLRWNESLSNKIIWLSISAFAMKVVLQFASAFPQVAALAYEQRNFVIAYLHLVLLGFVSLFAFGGVIKHYGIACTGLLKGGLLLFLFALAATELLLILQGLLAYVYLPFLHYRALFLLFSGMLVVSVGIITRCIWKRRMNTREPAQQQTVKQSAPAFTD